jgi:hypothetical protein
MSLWDAFIDDYERRRRDLLKRIELMEARLTHTGKPELERWITTTADSLEQAKADLAEIERLLEEAKAKVRAGD